MFCYQCEQTAGGSGCTQMGVCGKNPDIASLQDTLIFGLKGIAAYAHHARELGARDEQVDAFMHDALFFTLTNVNFSLERHVEMVLKCGEMNLRVMELLDTAHVERFGAPQPANVFVGLKKGHSILITGHDFLDLEALLQQTSDKNINVYTHGEMLPGHAYPKLAQYPHFAGHYGTAWQNQRKEFEAFPGPVIVTTNCVMPLTANETYADRIFLRSITGLQGGIQLADRDFSVVVAKAIEMQAVEEQVGKYTLTTGFHHSVILGLADKIIAAVKAGKIRRFFLIGGCDGARPGRNYYTEIAQKVPQDCIILTLACGKYRFNHLDFGDIDGIPRLLDLGQCNNAYSAIQIALALAKAFECGVNDLPLSMILSWYEQKAVAILLTLLHLGVQNIHVGPTPPAFLSPNVFKLLADNYSLKLITTPDEDLKAILG